MRKDKLPQELVIDLIPRSICNVQVAAVIVDRDDRILGWGWNNDGGYSSYGMCAERAAIKRANPKRLKGATIYVGGWRNTSKNFVHAFPCEKCMSMIKKKGISRVIHTTKEAGKWAVAMG